MGRNPSGVQGCPAARSCATLPPVTPRSRTFLLWALLLLVLAVFVTLGAMDEEGAYEDEAYGDEVYGDEGMLEVDYDRFVEHVLSGEVERVDVRGADLIVYSADDPPYTVRALAQPEIIDWIAQSGVPIGAARSSPSASVPVATPPVAASSAPPARPAFSRVRLRMISL